MGSPRPTLAGRRILITGGSSGIGFACAQRLVRAGARVVLLARGEAALREARDALGAGALSVATDVGDASALGEALRTATAWLGGLDAVVADAGATAYGPFAEMGPEDYEPTIRTTLLGVLHTAHAALPELERTGGTLVVVGSIAGRVPVPWLAPYTAAKYGVRGFVRCLHAELRALGSPVRVALVAPGPVDAPFWGRARTTDGRLPPRLAAVYRPEDVAREVERALARPGRERTVGGLMAAWAAFDALAPNLALRVTARLAGAGWRRRERRPPGGEDMLSQGAPAARLHAGLRSRPSLLVTLRDRVEAARR